MKRILCISGSRADYGLLEWPVKVLRESFEVDFDRLDATDPADAFLKAQKSLSYGADCLLILGDRWEILQAAIAAHLQRVPIAHIGGGDVTLGSYDDAMRDCISRLATWSFTTSTESFARLCGMESNGDVYMIGNIALDYIMHGDWKGERPLAAPYVVVSYQRETSDMTNELASLIDTLPKCHRIFMLSNADTGSDEINSLIKAYCENPNKNSSCWKSVPHGQFLNLLFHCEEFIGNSSAMLYEAPALGVKCRMIGKRQQGRVAPEGDGKASERIREVLCRVL